MANTSTQGFASALDQLLSLNASVSIYMAHGGTNFGFWSGANYGNFYQPHITSYDYDSPLSEGGQHGYGSDGSDKYAATQAVLLKYQAAAGAAPPPPEPPTPAFFATSFNLTKASDLFDNVPRLSNGSISVPAPNTTEQFGQYYGFTLFTGRVPASGPGSLVVNGVADRAQVFVNGEELGGRGVGGKERRRRTETGTKAETERGREKHRETDTKSEGLR